MERLETMNRARRAYELGRLRAALPVLGWVAPMIVVSVAGCGPVWGAAVGGGLLAALCVGFKWRGQELARAVEPGLVGGMVPLSLPLVLEVTGHGCATVACASVC